jgi:hypothetical protein
MNSEARKRLQEAEAMTDSELRSMAQGCTELTCVYHGIYNALLRDRHA